MLLARPAAVVQVHVVKLHPLALSFGFIHYVCKKNMRDIASASADTVPCYSTLVFLVAPILQPLVSLQLFFLTCYLRVLSIASASSAADSSGHPYYHGYLRHILCSMLVSIIHRTTAYSTARCWYQSTAQQSAI